MKTNNFFKRFCGAAMVALAMAMPLFTSCYDDSALNEKLEDIQAEVDELKSDHAALQAAVDNNLSVVDYKQIEGGYELTMSDGSTITILNGKDGAAGADGKDGNDGEDGEKGDQGTPGTPGTPGEKGDKGEPGKPGEKGDKGDKGDEGDAFFESVELSEDELYLVITLVGGTVYELPMGGFNLILEAPEALVKEGVAVKVSYTIVGAAETDEVFVRILASSNCTAEVLAADKAVSVTPELGEGYVDVYAINNTTGELKARTIAFNGYSFSVEATEFAASPLGGSVEVPVSTSVDYEVEIDGAWLKYVETKAVRNETLVFSAEAENTTGAALKATVALKEKETGMVLASFSVSQKPFFEELLGEYLESYSMSGTSYNGTLLIERSDDTSKGTYKVKVCGATMYADYIPAANAEAKNIFMLYYHTERTVDGVKVPVRNDYPVEVSADYDTFTASSFNVPTSLGLSQVSQYRAVSPLGPAQLTTEEQALVGVYNETWTHQNQQPAVNGMEIAASNEASYGQLKVKFFTTTDGSSFTAYAALEDSKLKVAVGGMNHPRFGTIWDPAAVIEFTVNADGTISLAKWQDGSWKNMTDYVATKVVESEGGDEGDGEVTDDPFVGTWTVTYEAAGDMQSYYDPKWATQTGEMTIELKDGNYVLATFAGKALNWTLTKDGNTFTYSESGVELALTYDEASGKLSTASGAEVTDWVSFKFRNIVATKN